ncbi:MULTISPECIES: hypothetical protein [unclassified Psychrobacter]|uniref:hypothetical protein n=1 Tax=unclassified Psychrobacter TaxID=196806 RepID=UPI0025B4A6FA|nr:MULTISPECIES: hypothetical protein [unclassified Psychrobacter]MDN3453605.1 hypothetical protein [Psychrobacter sp. APC 3350]MDN3501474.1 hypothetical protein [Psychrobacter sp. 5A.1]
MQKNQVSFIIGSSLLLVSTVTVTACQPTSNTPLPQAQAVEESRISMALENPEPSKKSLGVDAKTCVQLNQAMQKVDGTSKIEDIYAIQKQLDTCLPTASNAEVIELLSSYESMYKQFLVGDFDIDDEKFNSIVYDLYYEENVTSKQLATLSPRSQYLIGLIQSGADVRFRDLGEGWFSFDHDMLAMVNIFAPYLRNDQAAFIQRMAQDNQESFWMDASIAVSFAELIERATFWENYIQQYPNGYAVQDAKILLNLYRYVLFYGVDNTQWTDDAIHRFMEPNYKKIMLDLARRPNSILAKNAQLFLGFLALPDSERQTKYPVPSTDEDGYEIHDWSKVRYQLHQVLQIPSPWDVQHHRDCLNGISCVDDPIS